MKFKTTLNEDLDLEPILKKHGVKFRKVTKTRNGFNVDFGEFDASFVKEDAPGAYVINIETTTLDDLVAVGETLKLLGKIDWASE
jgi:hypothetical protein